jgi:hypothetical protein
MNSWVPNVLGSVTPPQWVLILTGRLARGPMPSRQWYSSAKQPRPAHQRHMQRPQRLDYIAAIALDIGDFRSGPTQIPP